MVLRWDSIRRSNDLIITEVSATGLQSLIPVVHSKRLLAVAFCYQLVTHSHDSLNPNSR